MKLPKGLGNMGALLKQAQDAMQRAKELEDELKLEVVECERDGVRVKYSGVGELLSIQIAKDLVDPADVEGLEDALLLVLREGYSKSLELRQRKVQEITGGLNLPGMGGL